MQTRISEFEKGMVTLETELSSTKAAFEETKAKEEETRLQFQRAVDDKKAAEVALADAEKAREEELETLREAKHALIAEKIQLGNKVESLEADLAAKREDLKTMLAETSEVRLAYANEHELSRALEHLSFFAFFAWNSVIIYFHAFILIPLPPLLRSEIGRYLRSSD